MGCAFQEEVASQVSAGVQHDAVCPSDALWTAESLAPLLGLQQSMSNQFAMHFIGNRASPGSPIIGTIPGLALFNGKDLLRLPHMIVISSSISSVDPSLRVFAVIMLQSLFICRCLCAKLRIICWTLNTLLRKHLY